MKFTEKKKKMYLALKKKKIVQSVKRDSTDFLGSKPQLHPLLTLDTYSIPHFLFCEMRTIIRTHRCYEDYMSSYRLSP